MTESPSQDEQDEIDPEVQMAKHMAYTRAKMRLHRKVVIISWILALPAFWFTWQSGVHQHLVTWLEPTETANPELAVLIIRLTTATFAWAAVIALLYPLRVYLKNRWAVDPERFGLDHSRGEAPIMRLFAIVVIFVIIYAVGSLAWEVLML